MMVISGDFTSIVAGVTQPKVENRKLQQSDQSSQTQFDDVLNKNKNDNLTASRESNKQAAKADSDKKYSDKIANDKTANDHALNNKQLNDKASADKATNTMASTNKVASNNAQQAASSENKVAAKEHDGKKEGRLKSSLQEEQNHTDDSAASSINHYLSQLNLPKDATSKEGNLSALHMKGEGNSEVTEADGVDEKNHDPLNSQLLSVKEKMDKLNTVGDSSKGQSGDGKMAGLNDEATNAQKLAHGQSTAQGEATDDNLKGLNPSLQKELGGAATSLTNGANGADNNSLSGQIVGAAQAKKQNNVKASDKDNTAEIDGKNDVKNKAGFAELKGDDIREAKSDDKSADTLSGRKQTSGRRVQNGANQATNSPNQQTNINNASDKLQATPTLNIGDKVAMTGNGSERRDVLGRIADVEVTENKKVGDMRVLRIKLNPENLGMVEARLRKTSEGLKIEIHAERQETARLLAADRHMLTKALEKSGFNDDGRLTIMVVDRSSQTVQQGQASNSGQSTPQDNSGQNFNGQRQFTGQQGQGEHNGSRQTFTEFPFTGTPLQEESVGEQTAYRDPRHLVV